MNDYKELARRHNKVGYNHTNNQVRQQVNNSVHICTIEMHVIKI